MPILETPFTCPNGHSFTANAKIRARCPTCGSMTRRGFESSNPPTESKPKETESIESPKPKVKRPMLLRQGRPRVPKRPVKSTHPVSKAKAPVTKPKPKIASVGKASAGIVRTTRVKGSVIPTINRRPKRTSVAKITQTGRPEREKPFWQKVKDRYF